jgi:2'-5' RNA ligase
MKTLHLETGDKDIEDEDIDHVEVTREESLRNKEAKVVNEFSKEVQATLSRDQQKEFVAHVTASNLEVKTAVELINLHGYAGTADIPVDKLEKLKSEITSIAKGATHSIAKEVAHA